MGLIDNLSPGPVAKDTAVFTYFIEAAPVWLPVIKPPRYSRPPTILLLPRAMKRC